MGAIGTAEQQKTFFGFSLQEIEAYDSILKQEDAAFDGVVQAKQGTYTKVVQEMESLAVKVRSLSQLVRPHLPALKAYC